MRDRMRKFFTAVIFLLFLIILTIPAESQAAVRYNLIKDVTSQKAPEGQLVRVAGKKLMGSTVLFFLGILTESYLNPWNLRLLFLFL